jgi:mono/diheme cytochrome c family protein
MAGCSRAPVLNFELDPATVELPERHQDNITATMERLFGTPANPRQRIPDPEAEEPEDEAEPMPLIDAVDAAHLAYGATVYNARCSGCHGATGDGAGPAAAYLQPKPRDYRRGIFKFTSTPYGLKPVRQDLVRTIRRGAKGTSMPAFPWMSDEDLDAVIDYVIYLSHRGEIESYVTVMADEYMEDEDVPFSEFADALEATRDKWDSAASRVIVPVSAAPPYSEETVLAGRKLFLSQGCSKCHGIDGKGQTQWLSAEFLAKQESLPEEQRVKINYDAWDEPAPAADLTARMLHGGRRPIDIYRRIYTGINGTPMPAFGGLFDQQPEQYWQLVHYVRHVIEGGDPTVGITDVEAPAEADAPAEDPDAEAQEAA